MKRSSILSDSVGVKTGLRGSNCYLEVYQNHAYEGALASRSQEEYQRQLLQKLVFLLFFQKNTSFIFL